MGVNSLIENQLKETKIQIKSLEVLETNIQKQLEVLNKKLLDLSKVPIIENNLTVEIINQNVLLYLKSKNKDLTFLETRQQQATQINFAITWLYSVIIGLTQMEIKEALKESFGLVVDRSSLSHRIKTVNDDFIRYKEFINLFSKAREN